ncbi:MAG: outer membrane beta-barrel protein [Burkholderiaceae bacterium]
MKTTFFLSAFALVSALLSVTSPASAQTSLTLFTGYAGSGGIENVSSDTNADMKSAATFGVALGMVLDPSRELQLYYNQQSTTLSPGEAAAPFDLTIRYLHVGGTLFIDRPISQGLYAVGGVGITHFSPGTSGYSDEVKPSINLGFGYLLPLGERIALRAEARGYFTLVNSSGGFLCSGGCVAVLKSEAVTQYEAKIGLMARF